jgi:hypothetical protein
MHTLLCKVDIIVDVPEAGNQAACAGDENTYEIQPVGTWNEK